MTIWVFGDSFGDIEESRYSFISLLSSKFQTSVQRLAKGGSSLGYMYDMFEQVESQFQKNDILILCVTEQARQYFFKDRPQVSKVEFVNYSKVSSAEKTAIKHYFGYLYNDDDQYNQLINFFYRLNYVTEKLNLITVCLPCFAPSASICEKNADRFLNIRFAQGSLYHDISKNEFKSDNTLLDRFNKADPRIGHMCSSNHTILFNKIEKNIETNTLIDLRAGFRRGIITEDSVLSNSFVRNEFFKSANL